MAGINKAAVKNLSGHSVSIPVIKASAHDLRSAKKEHQQPGDPTSQKPRSKHQNHGLSLKVMFTQQSSRQITNDSPDPSSSFSDDTGDEAEVGEDTDDENLESSSGSQDSESEFEGESDLTDNEATSSKSQGQWYRAYKAKGFMQRMSRMV
jgi:hypothetical protein